GRRDAAQRYGGSGGAARIGARAGVERPDRCAIAGVAAAGAGDPQKSGMLPRDDSAAPIPLLFLLADTGGGHRAAAQAVGEALAYAFPGRFAPVLCDPLGGPRAARLLRW